MNKPKPLWDLVIEWNDTLRFSPCGNMLKAELQKWDEYLKDDKVGPFVSKEILGIPEA